MTTEQESKYPVAPAPWTLIARAWLFVLPPLGKNVSFPAGFAVPFQEEAVTKGEFVGGIGSIQVISYQDTPVGPYDELIYVPGKFKAKDGKSYARITRIYVSSDASVFNGRRNWNIPKQRANFSITSTPQGHTTISVSHPSTPDTPFFRVTTKPVPILSSVRIPTSTSILGDYLKLSCPPLPPGEDDAEVSTEKWASLTPLISGKTSLALLDSSSGATEGEEGQGGGGLGDGKGFPKVKPYRVGVKMEDVTVEFGLAEWSDDM